MGRPIMYPESKKRKLSKEQSEIFVGSMLGDGMLGKPPLANGKTFYRVKRALADEEYLTWNRCKFAEFVYRDENRYETAYLKETNKHYPQVSFSTQTNGLFGVERKKWYPSDIKIIPASLKKLTPLIVAVWFCDDGCIILSKQGDLACTFCTNGFTKADTIRLKDMLIAFTGRSFGVQKTHSGAYVIVGSTNAAKRIVELILPHMPPGMDRKLEAYYEKLAHNDKNIENYGTGHWRAALNPTIVKKIRKLRKKGLGGTAIARQCNVSKSSVEGVIRGITWKHVL